MRLLPATSGAYIPSALSPLAFVIATKERAYYVLESMINDNLASSGHDQ
jgi:hypothetical protein